MKQRIDIHTPGNILLLTILIALISVSVVMLIGSLIAIPLYGISPSFLLSPTTDLSDPSSIHILKYLQILQTLGLFILPPFLVAYVIGRKPGKFLGLNRFPSGSMILYSALLVFAMGPVIYVVSDWNANFHFPEWLGGLEKWLNQTDQQTNELVKAFLDTEGTGGFLFSMLMIAIMPALGEEFLFRGVLQKQLIKLTHNKHLGIIFTAMLFSALHMQFSGFFPRFLLGAIFGYLFLWSGSLWLPIAAHFINNASAIIAHETMEQTPLDPLSGEDITGFPISVTLISLLICMGCMWAIYSSAKTNRSLNH